MIVKPKEVSPLDQEKPSTIQHQHEPPVILVVTRTSSLSEAAMDYSLNVAGRLKHRLLVAYVNTMPFLRLGGTRRERFAQGVSENVSILLEKSQKRGVSVAHVKESGKIGKVVSRLCRIVKKIDFVIIDDGVRVEEVVSRSPVPVFNVDKPLQARQFQNGEHTASVRQNSMRPRL